MTSSDDNDYKAREVTVSPPEGESGQGASPAEELRRTAGLAKAKLGDAKAGVRDEAGRLASEAQDRIRTAVERGQSQTTQGLSDFGAAIRRAGEELEGRDRGAPARLIQKAADGLEGFAASLADQGPEDMVRTVRDFGRNNPALFIAGSVFLGLAIGRLARSSARHDHGSDYEVDYDEGDYATESAGAYVAPVGGEATTSVESSTPMTSASSYSAAGASSGTGGAGYTGSSAGSEGSSSYTGATAAPSQTTTTPGTSTSTGVDLDPLAPGVSPGSNRGV